MSALSVYRQRTPGRSQIEVAQAFRDATTEQDVQLIGLSMQLEKPVLVGLSGAVVIIQPAVDGDEAHSFEALFDTALTVSDLRRMQAADVNDPSHLPKVVWHVVFDCPIETVLKVHCRVLAKEADSAHLRNTLKALANDSEAFNKDFAEAIVAAFRYWVFEGLVTPEYALRSASRVRDRTEVAEATPDHPPWKFVDR